MKPMTISSLKHQLSQFFCPELITRIARQTGFLKHGHAIEPSSLLLSLIAALSKGNCHAMINLHRTFNDMSLSKQQFVAYKPFHNQLRKPEFAQWMQQRKMILYLDHQFTRSDVVSSREHDDLPVPLTLLIRRFIAMQSQPSVSLHKAGKNVDVW